MPGVKLDILGNSNTAQQAIQNVLNALGQLSGAGHLLSGLGAKLTAALSAGALVEFTRRAIESADAVGKLAQKTGQAIQEMSGLGTVAASDNISLQAFQIGLKGLSEWMVKTGQAGRDTTDVLLDQADLFARMPDGASKVSLAIDRFGRSGQEMIPFLNKGSQAIREQVKEAEELGAVVGPAFAKSAGQFNDNLHRVGLVFQGLFNNVARELLPALNKMLEWFVEFAKRSDNFKPVVETIVVVFKSLAIAVAAVAGSFEAIGAFLGQFAGALVETGDPFEAWAAGADAASKAMERMDQMFDAINRKVEETGEAPEKGPAVRTKEDFERDAERLKLQLTQQRLFLERDTENREISAGERRKRQMDDLLLIEQTLKKERQLAINDFVGGALTKAEFDAYDLAAQKELLGIEKQRRELQADSSFVIRMRDNLMALSDQWSALGRNIADVLTNSIQTGVQGVTDAIMGAIDGTKTWGQVFLQVGRSIIASLIQVVVQWVAQMTIVRALQKIFHAEQQVQAGQRAAAEAPGAALAATSSYGAAAIIGGIALAAILALAIGAAAGAFATGGLVQGGEQLIRVNERGQEFVMNAAAVDRFGENFFANLNAGHSLPAAAAASPAAPAVKNEQNVHVVMFNNEARMSEYLRSAEGQKVLVDLMQNNLHQITGKS